MKILLIDNGTSLLEKLQELIPGAEVTKKWNEVSLKDLPQYDLFILSGNRNASVVSNHIDFLDEIALIKECKRPMIGICFGCELIAYTFGGGLAELGREHYGVRQIRVSAKELSEKPNINVYEHHRWYIHDVPKEFDVLARSDDGPEIIKHRSLPMYGLQFHPENFVDETEGDEIFRKILAQYFPTGSF